MSKQVQFETKISIDDRRRLSGFTALFFNLLNRAFCIDRW